MPTTSVVSAIAEGAARNFDIHGDGITGGFQGAYNVRDGYSPASNSLFIIGVTSVWGTAGPFGNNQVVRNNMAAHIVNGGCCMMNPVVPWVVTRPLNRFRWPRGRFLIETCLCYDTPAALAGVENGFFLSYSDFGLPITGVDLGVGVSNDGGTMKYISRSPAGGVESLAIAGLGNLQFWNKFGFMFQNATRDQDATMTLLVNDVPVLQRTNAFFGFTNSFWLSVIIGTKSTANFMSYAQAGFMAGPDSDIGVS